MQIIREIEALKSYLKEKRIAGNSIGLVPTMGALHRGHARLISHSIADNDVTVCTIFVNPAQFNNQEDLDRYPRTELEDSEMLSELGCDCIFIPSVTEMYSTEVTLNFNFGHLEEIMEGAFRPGHFNGVAIIVSKLFNIIQPDRAYFGQKDLQQLTIIKKLVNDLSFQIDIKSVPTVREKSGLAMSSRNKRLSKDAVESATIINKVLEDIEKDILDDKNFELVRTDSLITLRENNIEVEYLELVDANTLSKIENKKGDNSVAVCIAAIVDGVRLIDNRIF